MIERTPRPADEKVQRIIHWRESIMTLPDEQFFELIRIYLGEIQTPFNKQNLVEQLSSIFRKQEIKENILGLLSPFDLKVLTVLSLIEKATQQKIIDFFSQEYKLSEIYTELLNLNERMIIYYFRDSDSEKKIIRINPLLEDSILPYLDATCLFDQAVCAIPNTDIPFSISAQFIAAFISYVRAFPELCKNDGSIKKKDTERLEAIFQGRQHCLQLLLTGLLNLGILKTGEKAISIDENRLKIFSQQLPCNQVAFLSVASAVRLGREGLRSQAQLLLDLLATVSEQPVPYRTLTKTAFIICNKSANLDNGPAQNRFSRMLEARRAMDSANVYSSASSNYSIDGENSSRLIEKILASAIEFGIFQTIGQTEEGEPILRKSDLYADSSDSGKSSITATKGMININAGTSITLMPGLSLSNILEITMFMDIVNCNTVSEYEISRKSVSRAFDKNLQPSHIYEILSKYAAYDLPQSLLMNIEDWFNSYSSAILYKGYILKLDEKTARVFENNPKIKSFIKAKLAPCVFLLNIDENESPDEFISASGLDFMGSVRSAERTIDSAGFPLLRKGAISISITDPSKSNLPLKNLYEKAESEKSSLRQRLSTMELNDQQRECLLSRINRGVIVSPLQLNKENVRLEILEADGIDYPNKVRLIEKAISNKDSIEILVPSIKSETQTESILGKPLSIAKQDNDRLVKIHINETEEIRFYSVSKIAKVKLIKTSVFAN